MHLTLPRLMSPGHANAIPPHGVDVQLLSATGVVTGFRCAKPLTVLGGQGGAGLAPSLSGSRRLRAIGAGTPFTGPGGHEPREQNRKLRQVVADPTLHRHILSSRPRG